jgi:hypothetical protein
MYKLKYMRETVLFTIYNSLSQSFPLKIPHRRNLREKIQLMNFRFTTYWRGTLFLPVHHLLICAINICWVSGMIEVLGTMFEPLFVAQEERKAQDSPSSHQFNCSILQTVSISMQKTDNGQLLGAKLDNEWSLGLPSSSLCVVLTSLWDHFPVTSMCNTGKMIYGMYKYQGESTMPVPKEYP